MESTEFAAQRQRLVRGLASRGAVFDPRVLSALGNVPRHAFVPEGLAEHAYDDVPLPIGNGQTISQPYIVALMLQALGLSGRERVLEVGTGSGYAAAVLSRLAGEVHTVERIEALAHSAATKLAELGFANVHVHHSDGTLGWKRDAPYDAIVVAAGGPTVPPALLDQLVDGGRLVIPVGGTTEQMLVRVRRSGERFEREELEDVRFVPLIGAAGWSESPGRVAPARASSESAVALIREVGEPIADIEEMPLGPLLDRIGDARVVLLGEATHGTSEFYRMRSRITRELVLRRGFDVVAVEADWPDASRVDRYVRALKPSEYRFTPFSRFPTWMWRNHEAHALIEWLRAFNATQRVATTRVCFFGLDLYSLFTSAAAVIAYLQTVDPSAASAARARYGLLSPWQLDPAAYGHAVLTGETQAHEAPVMATLKKLLERRLDYARRDGYRFFDAAQNAKLVADAERYYRAMYRGATESWNLRDQHMFDTLLSILEERGPTSKAVVWAHNSHCGDAGATELGDRGELNIGSLCRQHFEGSAYHVGFGTDHGMVAAAHDWDAPMESMEVRPAHPLSYERLFHQARVPALLLSLRNPARTAVTDELSARRLERAIGVVYRPATELSSHYFLASLPRQFDEYIWFDETSAIHPLPGSIRRPHVSSTYPFTI